MKDVVRRAVAVEESACRFLWEYLKERDRMEYLGLYGRIILKFAFKMGCEGVGWIHLS